MSSEALLWLYNPLSDKWTSNRLGFASDSRVSYDTASLALCFFPYIKSRYSWHRDILSYCCWDTFVTHLTYSFHFFTLPFLSLHSMKTSLITPLCSDITSFKDHISTMILENQSGALDTTHYWLGKAHTDLNTLHPSPNEQLVLERKLSVHHLLSLLLRSILGYSVALTAWGWEAVGSHVASLFLHYCSEHSNFHPSAHHLFFLL